MEIRSAVPDDIEEVTRLFIVLRDHHAQLEPDNLRYRTPDESWRGEAVRVLNDDAHVLLAEDGGETIGMAVVRFVHKPWGQSCEVETLVVDEGRRRAGIGEGLMARAEEIGREAKSPAARVNVAFNNTEGRRFYERLGYLPLSTRFGKEL